MKILLISDVESKYLWDFLKPENFKDIEMVISCGDLKADYMSYLVTILKVPLFYVYGNHDEDYDRNPPYGCDCIDDMLITFKGLRILGLGGSKRYNQGKYQYTERDMKKRIKKLRWKLYFKKGFDILVTHAASYGLGDDEDKCHEGFRTFLDLMDKYKPKFQFHGHSHLNYSRNERFNTYHDTIIVNAFGYHIIDTNDPKNKGVSISI